MGLALRNRAKPALGKDLRQSRTNGNLPEWTGVTAHFPGRECQIGRRASNLSALVERIAGFDTARIETAPEPLRTLGGTAVRKAVRHHLSATFSLQGVVANG